LKKFDIFNAKHKINECTIFSVSLEKTYFSSLSSDIYFISFDQWQVPIACVLWYQNNKRKFAFCALKIYNQTKSVELQEQFLIERKLLRFEITTRLVFHDSSKSGIVRFLPETYYMMALELVYVSNSQENLTLFTSKASRSWRCSKLFLFLETTGAEKLFFSKYTTINMDDPNADTEW
jgi:hypothetical protein